MRKKRIATIVAAMGLTLASAMPVMAAESDINPSSGEVPVTLNVTSNYTVTLPASIILEYESQGEYEAEPVFASDYDITVKGTIASIYGLRITGSDIDISKDGAKVFTAENYMDKANTADKTEKTTSFVSSASTDGVTTSNRIEHAAAGISPGTYEGTANFTYTLEL